MAFQSYVVFAWKITRLIGYTTITVCD
uniref:Uncharacterized protein n=1 Tax=Arundo donax TaxID=35708 RepID=A0A0A9AL47_ARUDO